MQKMRNNIRNVYEKMEKFGDHEDLHLTNCQLIFICAFQLLNLHSFLCLYDLMAAFSMGYAFSIYAIGVYILAVPIHMIMIFLALYTKRKIIRLFDCIPLFKGLGFSILLLKNTNLLENNYMTSLFFNWLYIFSYKNNNTNYNLINCGKFWRSCEFDPKSSCVSLNNESYVNCSKNGEYITSLSQFFKKFVTLNSPTGKVTFDDDIKVNLILVSMILWFLMGFFIFLGVKKLLKVYMALFLIAILGIFITLMAFQFQVGYADRSPRDYIMGTYKARKTDDANNLTMYAFYCIETVWIQECATTAWIGSAAKKKTRIAVIIISIFLLKLLGYFMLMAAMNSALLSFYKTFKNIITQCPTKTNSYRILFDLTINTMYDFDKRSLWFSIYINCFMVYTFIINIICGIIIVDSVLGAFPGLKNRRLIVSYIFVLINFLLSIIKYTAIENAFSFAFNTISMKIVTLIIYVLISLSFNYFYSLNVIQTDYIFTYHEQPTYSLDLMMEASCVFALVMFSSGCFWIFFISPKIYTGTELLIAVFIAFLLLLPILIGIMIEMVHGATRGINWRPFQPHPSWGPANPRDRNNRLGFIPDRDIGYRHTSVTCTHKCLVKNSVFMNEKNLQKLKLEKLREELRKRRGVDLEN